jgi:hypothetical protein
MRFPPSSSVVSIGALNHCLISRRGGMTRQRRAAQVRQDQDFKSGDRLRLLFVIVALAAQTLQAAFQGHPTLHMT